MTLAQDAFPLILLILAALALASIPLLRALSRRRARTVVPQGPIPVPPEEAEMIEGPVWACMRCGSTDVGMGGVSQGLIPGAGAQFLYVCRRCGHRGPPLEFENTTAYRQFVKGLHDEEEA